MNVDQNELMKALDLIQSKLDTCEFISLHLLSTHRVEDRFERIFFNDHEDFYQCCLRALEENPHDFQILEIGLIIWRTDLQGDTTYQSFNFPIFPSPSTLLPLSQRSKFFTLDQGTISSLLERDFKFNTWIKDSITHLTIFESDTATKKLTANQNETTEPKLEGDDAAFMGDMTVKMGEFLENKEQTILRFPPCNAWKRRLIYQTFKAEPYSKTTFLQTCKQQRDVVVVNKLSEIEVKRRLEEYFNKQIGFLSVFQLLAKSQKPIVGYNFFCDLLILYKTFWTFPPRVLEQFKEIFGSLFPRVVDIHHMAEGLFKNDCLEELFLQLDTKYKTLEIAKQVTSNSKAFKIGTTFIKLMNNFYKLDHPEEKFHLSNAGELIERFKNKISMPKNFDLQMIDLSNDEAIIERGHLRIVRILAEERFLDIEEYLKEAKCSIVTWFNNDEFLIKLEKDIVPNHDQSEMFQLLKVEEYFQELKILEERLREEKEREMQAELDFDTAFGENGYGIGEMKLPPDEDGDDAEIRQTIMALINEVHKSQTTSIDIDEDQTLNRSCNLDQEMELEEVAIPPKKSKRSKTIEGLFDENIDWTC